jgi:hypothetical protein
MSGLGKSPEIKDTGNLFCILKYENCSEIKLFKIAACALLYKFLLDRHNTALKQDEYFADLPTDCIVQCSLSTGSCCDGQGILGILLQAMCLNIQ